MQNNFVSDVRSKANGYWASILERLAIPTNRGEGPCPACGGNTRYRFDNKDNRGTYYCSHCGAGTGLDLVMKVNQCDARKAAELVAEAMALPMPEPKPAREKPQTDITGKVALLAAKASTGLSTYLASKGLQYPFPALPDGSLLVTLVNDNGEVTGAQVIKPDGSKRLVAGTVKKGSYCVVNSVEIPGLVVIAEGLATTISVSQMRPDALAISAIDAGNLPPVAEAMRRKFPDAQIIIAGDNDWHSPGELDEKGKPKVNTGMLAAKKAASSVAGWVSVPPTDSKMDWDDYRQQNGMEAAIEAFSNSMYQPEGAKVKPQSQAIEGGKITAKDESTTDPLKPRIESRKDGVFWVTPKVDKESGEIINNESWLCSPLDVIGTGRDDKDQYLIIRWLAFGSDAMTTAAVPLADIGEREGWRILKAGGVNVTTKSSLRAILADWLQRSGSRELWRVAHATGWQSGAYIMPDGDIIGTPDKPVLFNGRSSAAAGYGIKGSVESWCNSVGRLANGNYSMMTATAAALAAPLIGLSGNDSFGIHFYEQSSAGKTTTQNVASCLYGDPEALRLTWYGTALGLINEAAAHNDGLMPLDEVGQGSDPVSVSQSAYALFNGVGKLQGAKEGGNRDLKRWRTIAISTGEMDMETFIATSGRQAKAGQLVRLLNIPLSKAINLHGHKNGKEHADALKEAYQNNYGAAGREWVKWLADNKEQAVNRVRECEQRWRNLIPADYGEQVHRVGARFAILEASLILSNVITGWDAQTCRDAIQHSYNAWLREFGTGNKEHQQIIEQTEAFLNAYGLSRFAPMNYDPRDLPISELMGYRDNGERFDDPMLFYVLPEPFKKHVAGNHNKDVAARILHEAGMLRKPASGKNWQIRTPRLKHLNNTRPWTYVLLFAPESEESEDE